MCRLLADVWIDHIENFRKNNVLKAFYIRIRLSRFRIYIFNSTRPQFPFKHFNTAVLFLGPINVHSFPTWHPLKTCAADVLAIYVYLSRSCAELHPFFEHLRTYRPHAVRQMHLTTRYATHAKRHSCGCPTASEGLTRRASRQKECIKSVVVARKQQTWCVFANALAPSKCISRLALTVFFLGTET